MTTRQTQVNTRVCYMASARLWHRAALPAKCAFAAGAADSAAARSKCVAASLSSATERGPASKRYTARTARYPASCGLP